MEFRLLGPLEVSEEGRVLEIRAPKEQTLLAVLLLHANETVSTERLIDELWGELPPPRAAKLVATYVWQVRKRLGPLVVTRSPGYSVQVSPEDLDSARFGTLVARAQGEPPATAVETLAEALALWRGAALADVVFRSFAQHDAARLDDQRLAAVAERIDHELALGRHEEVLAEVQALVAAHPFRERYRAQLMLALYRAGRQAEALESYRQTRRRFVDELGIEPGPELQRLERAILDHDRALDVTATSSAPATAGTTLPRPASSFVGRSQELGDLHVIVGEGARLVTLTGPGGVGKTRLALEAATTLGARYADGVFWVGLAALREPTLVLDAIAHAVGARDDLRQHVGSRQMLVLVDNFEQVIEAAPDLASLAAACPSLTLLVTSRERLRVDGEVEYEVPPLAAEEAVSLFCNRARVDPSPEIAVLCARLDNLPLAVELAAARARALSPTRLLELLPQRLDLLRGRRDADPRHQTLRATIEWSYDLLPEDERRLFARLAVFAGGCELQAAEKVCGAGIETLQSLVEKSLIRFSGERYGMLETIRELAVERLARSGERDALMERLSRYLVDLANEQGAPLFLERAAEAYARLDLEHANVRAVVEWAVAHGRHELVAELVAVLRDVWTSRSDSVEVVRWAHHALRARGKMVDELWPHVLLGAEQVLTLRAGDTKRARLLMEEALEVLGRTEPQPWLEAMCLSELAGIRQEENLEEARAWAERSLAVRVEHGLPTARAFTDLGSIALAAEDLEQAASLLEQARSGWASLGLESNVASSLRMLGEIARRRGDDDTAVTLLSEAVRRAASLGDGVAVGESLQDLAIVAKRRGELHRAARLWQAGSALAGAAVLPTSPLFPREIGDLPDVAPPVREPTLDDAVELASELVLTGAAQRLE